MLYHGELPVNMQFFLGVGGILGARGGFVLLLHSAQPNVIVFSK